MVRFGCHFECTLERCLDAEADEVVLGHDQQC